MTTPVIEAIDNVNQTSLETVFAAVAADPTARDNLSQSNQNIDKVSTNVGVIEQLNTNEDAILRLLCRREGRDPENFADLDAVAADQNLMQAIAARQQSSKIMARSGLAMDAVAGSEIAMLECSRSTTAFNEITNSSLADTKFCESTHYITTINDHANLSISSSGPASTLASLSGGMSAVAGSATATERLASTVKSMEEVAANTNTAVAEIASSQTAVEEILKKPDPAILELDKVNAAADQFFQSNQLSGAIESVASISLSTSGGLDDIAGNETALGELAASKDAMDLLTSSSRALKIIAEDPNVVNTVYSNNASISALNDSPIKRTVEQRIGQIRDTGPRNTQTILLSFDPGSNGNVDTGPLHGQSDNSFPQTAPKIERTNQTNSDSPTDVTSVFIDIPNNGISGDEDDQF